MKLRIGWIPWCYQMGALPLYFCRLKAHVKKFHAGPGHKFHILPVFVEVPKK